MKIEIRSASPNEADALSRIAFSAKAHWGYPKRWMEIWSPQLTFTPEYFQENESWVAEIDGDPIAFYTLQDRDGIVWIENLWVMPEYIGKGIGQELFLHAIEMARQRGYKSLQLEADPNAMGFYEKMGMRKIGERHSEVDGQPRILPLMEMTL
ncbi:MAG: GNAT family N-acetyltransferase [Anaerolineae bacterium]|nr:MAG: GNAT family N-acetyltransferase [Anaerolineae bacterium]WKZ45206.1 MAG: GNAT family N-acetyltransferase [Anaerolineales bacterium]